MPLPLKKHRNLTSYCISKRLENFNKFGFVYNAHSVMHNVSSAAHPGQTPHTLLNSHTDSSESQFPKSVSAVTSSLSISLQRNNGGHSFGVFWGNPAQVTGGRFICRRGMVRLISLSPHKINSPDNGQWQVVLYLNTLDLFYVPSLFTVNPEVMVNVLLELHLFNAEKTSESVNPPIFLSALTSLTQEYWQITTSEQQWLVSDSNLSIIRIFFDKLFIGSLMGIFLCSSVL